MEKWTSFKIGRKITEKTGVSMPFSEAIATYIQITAQ